MKSKVSLLGVIVVATAFVPIRADPPSWWDARGGLTGSSANDYAVANIGQFKNLTKLAVDELNADLPGGAGTALDSLITTWQTAPGSGVTRNDFAAVNLGQVKYVTTMIYDQLAAAGYQGPPLTAGQTYPWTGTGANDYAVTNLGQLKYVFSFDLSFTDSDQDGIPDSWEIYYGLNPHNAGDALALAADGSGLTNLDEYRKHRNPRDPHDDPGTPATGDLVLHSLTGPYYSVSTATWAITTVGSP
jgi:hypothetical protein